MRNILILICSFIICPVVITLLFSLFFEEIKIGNGGTTVENHLLGKKILIEVQGVYKEIDVEEYVLGVLPGVIPADYTEECLMVQAILIRTNVLKEMEEKNTSDAEDLSYHYLSESDCKALWGEPLYEKNKRRMEQAVVKTAGRVIRKENQLITAMYHEVSIGKTISAKELLGEDISYLQSVESSKDVESKRYMNLLVYSFEELKEILKIEEKNVAIEITESTENGFVKQITINGKSYSGTEAMELFSLPSENFYVEEVEMGYRFVCLGKGSCLGLSQYGANRMALEGAIAEEIIQYYYQDVSIENYYREEQEKDK